MQCQNPLSDGDWSKEQVEAAWENEGGASLKPTADDVLLDLPSSDSPGREPPAAYE